MKKIISVFVALCLCTALLCGCKGEGKKSDKLSIVTTIFPQYDFARAIGGDKAEVIMLASPGSEVHSFEATLSDIAKIEQCDLFIYVGGESESWLDSVFEAMGSSCPEKIALMDMVEPRLEQYIEGMERENGEDEEEYDEHVWTSVKNCAVIAEEICSAMCKADPANEEYYRANAADIIAGLGELDKTFEEITLNAKRKTLVFAERFPFAYFAADYGLDCYAAFKGCSSETEPSLATISFLTDKVKQSGLPAVFYIEFSTEKVADTICAATGAKKLLFHSCHNVSRKDFENGVTYIELMRQNAENLREALN
ncbi:MAG: zinc ABC transporter substrate-binding protein [Clostridia bacterium]|nr:zinc ABC transporter substrate-binding protein [Clostridia bacterium]